MSFENTKNNLANLENNGPISDEVMFNLLGIVIKDIQAANKNLEVPEMSADEKRSFALAVRNVLKKTLRAFQSNQDSFQQLSARSQDECQELVTKIRELEGELDNYAQVDSERERLKRQFDELQSKNHVLRKAADECRILQARIEEFSDNALEGKEEERNRLQADLQAREEKARKIQTEIDEINVSIATIQNNSQSKAKEKEGLDNQLQTLNQELMALEETIKSQRVEYSKIGKVIADTKTANEALLEQQSEYSELFVALNSILSDSFVVQNLFKLDGSPEVLSISESPDVKEIGMQINSAADLESWISKIQQRIEILINLYQAELQKIIERSEMFTSLSSNL